MKSSARCKARYDAVNLARATAIENVSAGYFSLADALRGWQSSPPHNANLLKPGMRKLGIATAYAPGTRFLVFLGARYEQLRIPLPLVGRGRGWGLSLRSSATTPTPDRCAVRPSHKGEGVHPNNPPCAGFSGFSVSAARSARSGAARLAKPCHSASTKLGSIS